MAESGLLDDVDVEAPLLWDLDDNVGTDAAAGRKCAVAPWVGRQWSTSVGSLWIVEQTDDLPSGKLTVCDIEHGPVEIVTFPISMVIFHIVMLVYQRVSKHPIISI